MVLALPSAGIVASPDPAASNGALTAIERGRRMVSLVTSAMLAGKTITVGIDVAKKNSSGYCKALTVETP